MPETSSRIILKSGNEVLMSRGNTGSVKFIGGRLSGNEDPLEAAIREAREEGGVDLSSLYSSIVSLPYQDNDPKRPSYWFGVNTPRYGQDELQCGDDVLELFWVSLRMVETTLTYDNWREHWVKNLLPNLQ